MLIAKVARQLGRGFRDRRPRDRGVRILTYHGVVERRADPRVEANFHLLADFREHVRFLRRCRVVSLDELDEPLRARHPWPCVAITFDDGFRNNLLAAEILASAKLPATIFVATQNVTRGETIWPSLLRLVLARGSKRVVMVGGQPYDLDGDETSFGRARTAFKAAPAPARTVMWAELVAQLRDGELAELCAQFPSLAMMSWNEVASLGSSGIAIGSHGMFHELHHEGQPLEVRMHELTASRSQIEAALGKRCELFAYPNGTFIPSSPEELRLAGYSAGFTMVSRAAGATHDRMLLPRLVPGAGAEKLISTLVFGN